jgi:hypothetical protein
MTSEQEDEPLPTHVHPEAFFTADHAVVESGKLYANGAFWNRLNFPSFPVVHNFAVCVILHIPWRAHHERHAFGITFEDGDGKVMPQRLGGYIQTGTAPDMRAGDYSVVPIAMMVNGFVLERPGEYAAVLRIADKESARWRFRATQVLGLSGIPQTPGGGGPTTIPGLPPGDK